MDFRIVIETEKSGKKWYYVQKRNFFYIWCYLREVRDITMTPYKVGWRTLKEAEKHIQDYVDLEYAKSQKKIIRREYVNK